MSVKIQKGIPIPPRNRMYEHTIVDWGKVESGDSVFVQGLLSGTPLYSSLWQQAKRRGFNMVTRSEKNGRRVWFIKV